MKFKGANPSHKCHNNYCSLPKITHLWHLFELAHFHPQLDIQNLNSKQQKDTENFIQSHFSVKQLHFHFQTEAFFLFRWQHEIYFCVSFSFTAFLKLFIIFFVAKKIVYLFLFLINTIWFRVRVNDNFYLFIVVPLRK